MKNHRALTVLLALLELFLLAPPLVLTKVQVNFADLAERYCDSLFRTPDHLWTEG